MEIIFATANLNKLKEVQEMLGSKYTLKTPADFEITEDIEETADTLEGNAAIKAEYIWSKLGKTCFSDDTGLEVKALNGEPGVRSARYAGEGKNSEDNMVKLLHELEDKEDRSAQFRCSIALIWEGKTYNFDGICEGEIAEEKIGEGGFGYDPIFIPKGYDKSFAELSSEEKNLISHRGLAINALRAWLEKQ